MVPSPSRSYVFLRARNKGQAPAAREEDAPRITNVPPYLVDGLFPPHRIFPPLRRASASAERN